MRNPCVAFVPLLAAAVLLLGTSPALSAQQSAIRGTVTDAQTGEPIAGAQIAVRGTGIGTLTNNEGRYVLPSVPAGRVELRVEYIGYSPQSRTVSVAAGETLTADFQMGVAAIELDELVATGYAQQTRRQVSSAVSTVGSAELQNHVVASLDAALQGRASGVQVVQNAGNPGNAVTVRVRGSASISASNQPLYVVDGVPIYREDFGQLGFGGQDLNAITGLNPDEIASINILKDAAAAAIYGSRGSNGVVMITTKRGASGAPRVTVNLSGGMQDVPHKPRMLNRQEWIDYFSAAMRFDGYSEADIQDELDWLGVTAHAGVDTDWIDEVTRTAPISNTQVAISGGSDRFKYYLSGSYFDQTGVVIGSRYDRAAGRVNLDFQASDRLSFTASVALSQEDNDRIESDNSIESAVTNAIANEPWAPIRNPDGTWNADASYSNPVATGLENYANARTIRSFGNIAATYGVTDWLRATGRAGYDVLNLREYRYNSPLVPLTYASGVDGVSRIGNSAGNLYILEGFLNADRIIGVHDISVTAGASVELDKQESSFLRGEGFTSPELQWPRNAARIVSIDGTRWDHNLVSYFSRATYTLDDRYVVNGSIRADGSSRFGERDRFGVFPAISAAWLVGSEPFMQDVGLFSDLRLRASWGVTGNEAIGNFQFLGLYGSSNYGDDPGIAPANLANPNLKWERTQEWNVGFDAGFLDDRLGLVGEIYKKNTDDLLLSRPITATSGFTSVLDNIGSMENSGWEMSLRSVNIRPSRAGGLEWITEFNVTHNRNRVTGLAGDDEPFNTGLYSANRVEVGQPLGAFHLVNFEGVDPETGNALYSELDADGNRIGTTLSPSADDRMIVGSPHPDYFGGFRNTLSWGAFDLAAFLEFSQGNDIYNAMRRFGDDGGYYYDNKFADVLNHWTPENPNTSMPRPSYFGRSGARLNSSRFVEDGSYVRLQELTLGYDLPQAVTGLMRMGTGRLYVSGKNIHTWTDYTSFSPDVNSAGGSGASASLGTDFYAYPIARTFTIGFQGSW